MARPVQDVRIWDIQDRRKRRNAARPWVVRWLVDGGEHSRARRTKAEADNYRSRLLVAVRDGERFDHDSGEPVSWQPIADDARIHEWARRWLIEQWPEWQPRTRTSAVEAISRFIPLARLSKAPAPADELRTYLVGALRPDAAIEPGNEHERWLSRWSLPLSRLDRDTLAGVERQLVTGLTGQPLSASVAGRYRKVAHACIRRAAELEVIPSDPWPPAPRGRSRRKAVRKRRSVDTHLLPDPATMARIIQTIRSHQPGSRTYQVMTAVSYYAGLRPSEVVMLRPRVLELPATGWGRAHVVEADIDWDEPGEPKEGERFVPLPPQLVVVLRSWIEDQGIGNDNLLFRTRNDKRPTPSNWARALKRACTKAGHRPIRVYDCRHAAATTWLSAGVPLGEIARRLGHSVETLVSTYVGALQGDEAVANDRIEAVLAPLGSTARKTSPRKHTAAKPKLVAV